MSNIDDYLKKSEESMKEAEQIHNDTGEHARANYHATMAVFYQNKATIEILKTIYQKVEKIDRENRL